MVKCSNTVACRNGAWFHIDCVGVDLNDIGKVDWCCSDECQATGRSQYCICQLYTDKETVHCIRGANCSGYEVYHKECIGLKRKPGMS